MIITFKLQKGMMKLQVDENHEVYISSYNTNNKMLPITVLIKKAKTPQERMIWENFREAILYTCPHKKDTKEFIERYIIREFLSNPLFMTQGIKHVNTRW